MTQSNIPTRNELLAELALYTIKRIHADEVTVPMMAKEWGISTQSASKQLRQLEAEGTLNAPIMRRLPSGQPVLAWSKASKNGKR